MCGSNHVPDDQQLGEKCAGIRYSIEHEAMSFLFFVELDLCVVILISQFNMTLY